MKLPTKQYSFSYQRCTLIIFTLFCCIEKNPGGDLQFANTAGRGRAGLHAHLPSSVVS